MKVEGWDSDCQLAIRWESGHSTLQEAGGGLQGVRAELRVLGEVLANHARYEDSVPVRRGKSKKCADH